MQVACSPDLIARIATLKHVGCTNDANAFASCSMKQINELLPFPYHFNGDNAYTLSETMMIPFSGKNLHILQPFFEEINFYHSQLRIHV